MKYPDMKQTYPDFRDYMLILTAWLRVLNKGQDPVEVFYWYVWEHLNPPVAW